MSMHTNENDGTAGYPMLPVTTETDRAAGALARAGVRKDKPADGMAQAQGPAAARRSHGASVLVDRTLQQAPAVQIAAWDPPRRSGVGYRLPPLFLSEAAIRAVAGLLAGEAHRAWRVAAVDWLCQIADNGLYELFEAALRAPNLAAGTLLLVPAALLAQLSAEACVAEVCCAWQACVAEERR
jgi:hypothetical protein